MTGTRGIVAPYSRLRSPDVLGAMRGGLDGLTCSEMARRMRVSQKVVQRAVADLRELGLVRPAHTLMAYDEPWPQLEAPHASRVLRQVRRKPRTPAELARDMEPVGYVDSLARITYIVDRLRRYGHLAPAGVWLTETTRAPRTS